MRASRKPSEESGNLLLLMTTKRQEQEEHEHEHEHENQEHEHEHEEHAKTPKTEDGGGATTPSSYRDEKKKMGKWKGGGDQNSGGRKRHARPDPLSIAIYPGATRGDQCECGMKGPDCIPGRMNGSHKAHLIAHQFQPSARILQGLSENRACLLSSL